MKVILGVAVAAMLFAAPALAQTTPAPAAVPPSTCGEAPAVPTLPDGATTTRRQDMDAANTTYTAWAESYRANIVCRHAEAEALMAQATARAAEHNAAVEAFNATTTAWQAEVAEYNARGGRRR